ncbi:MAG TPA: flagellin [Solirubrobacteraceae bacterium]|jgi:flagellin|nr:flagellin [Solirubrobacteraceae bacterium]
MSLSINTNIDSLIVQRNMNTSESMLTKSTERLSSGLRINSAADDVAGYAANQRLQGQVNGVNQAAQNTQEAVALVQTAQGALNDVEQMLQRIRELAVQLANGTNSESDKKAIEGESEQLTKEIERVGETTKFNGVELLAKAEGIKFQVGPNEAETIEVKTAVLKEDSKGIKIKEIKTVEEAIEKVATLAGEFGSVQDRLQYTQSNQAIYGENLSAAQSSLVDANMAAEMSNFTKAQVLQQADVAILAQANSLPQAVLKLVGG